MEVVLDSSEELLKEELIFEHGVSGLSGCSHKHLSHSIFNSSVVILSKQVWNLANSQDCIDVLNKGLLCDLIV